MYYLDLDSDSSHKTSQVNNVVRSSSDKERVILWHHRLEHLSFNYLRKIKPELFLSIPNSKFKCNICELANNHHISYVPSYNKNSIPFMTIHSDVWGPARISTLSSARYFIIFINECTRMTWVSLLSNKGDVCFIFQDLYKMVAT